MNATPPKYIKDFQAFLNEIYGAANKERSSDYLYGYLSRSAAYLGKNLSQGQATDQHFLRVVSWIFAIANYFEIDIQECLFSRFPGICPYCLSSPCICHRTKKQPVSYIPAYKAQEERQAKFSMYKNHNHDWSFAAAAKNLQNVYPNNEIIWHYAGPWHLLAKMQEEIGEVHEAISKFTVGKKPKSSIEEELADTCAWVISAWGIVIPKRTIDDALVDYYISGCPVCSSNPCACNDWSDRSAELVDPEVLTRIDDEIGELEKLLPDARSALAELRKSLQVAKESQSEPITSHAVTETKGLIHKIRDGIEATDDTGKKVLSITETVSKLLALLPWP